MHCSWIWMTISHYWGLNFYVKNKVGTLQWLGCGHCTARASMIPTFLLFFFFFFFFYASLITYCMSFPGSSIFSSVQSVSRVPLFVTPWTTAHQASLPITNSRSLPKLVSVVSVMPSSHLILCHPLLFLPSIFPSIRVFSNESRLYYLYLKAGFHQDSS